VKRTSLIATAAITGVSAILLSACASSPSSSSPSGSTTASTNASGSKTACVILPDAASSPRWETLDRPDLQNALTAAGFTANIQNAQGDTGKYATIAQQELAQGCGVMLLVDYNGAGQAVAATAKAQGIPVIAYDRPITGADYYVSFDNAKVGALEAQAVIDGLKAAGKSVASSRIVFMGGDPSDGNAKMFHDGALAAFQAAGLTKPAAEPTGAWDQQKSATNFENAFTSLSGKVDAVWVANDTDAAGVIQILDKNNLKLPVSGQDASIVGLQNILLGKQSGTVWKHVPDEAKAASDLAIQLLKGQKPTVTKTLSDGTPYVAVTPVLVEAKASGDVQDVEAVVKAGDAKASDICNTAALQAACATYGVK